jgi:hypothetical protein
VAGDFLFQWNLCNSLAKPMEGACCIATGPVGGWQAVSGDAPEIANSQNLRRNSGLWIKLEQVSEV